MDPRPSKRGNVRGRRPAPERLPNEQAPDEAKSNDYRQAALELNAAIRSALGWVAAGAEPSVAWSQLLKTANRWQSFLEGTMKWRCVTCGKEGEIHGGGDVMERMFAAHGRPYEDHEFETNLSKEETDERGR